MCSLLAYTACPPPIPAPCGPRHDASIVLPPGSASGLVSAAPFHGAALSCCARLWDRLGADGVNELPNAASLLELVEEESKVDEGGDDDLRCI